MLDQARSPTVPGANDNASGVAALLAVVTRLAAEPLDDVDVIALVPGCEESGMGGMAAWLRAHGGGFDPATTLVVGLDTVGSGEPIVLEAEGGLWPVRYRDEDVELAERAAERDGVALRRASQRLDRPGAGAARGPAGDLAAVGARRRLSQLPPSERHPGSGRLRMRGGRVRAALAIARASVD